MIPTTTRQAARRFGDATAYVDDGGEPLSYVELDRRSDHLAAGLRSAGVQPGDVVAVVAPPGLAYVCTYVAAAKVGAITAGVNVRLTLPERAALLERAGPRLVVAADAEVPDGWSAAGADELIRLGGRTEAAVPGLPDDPDRPVAIVFTSGTTGLPKGAVYANRQLAAITAVDVGERWGDGGRSLAATSFAHLGFMTKLCATLRRGGTTWIHRRFDAGRALRTTAEHRMTSVAGVPAQLALMLAHPDFARTDLRSVRFVVTGGGPLTPELAHRVRDRFDAALATRYSCTEAGIGLGTGFEDPEEDAVVSVGRPHPGVELALRDPDGRDVPAGDVGEVCLRSPAVMCGYWRDPEATASAFTADGFVRTGDLGWLDDRGRLRLVGRTSERYVRGGENVHPVEVEAVLADHPAVEAVAVVARPDPVMGEVGVACVVPAAGARPPTLAELRAHGAERLARHKLPEDLVVLEALPLTAMDKVDRRALAAVVAAAPGAPAGRASGSPGPPGPAAGQPRPHGPDGDVR
jgi:acyl-CoA synthetase (AMP-forming)/AMP-acid ligase II